MKSAPLAAGVAAAAAAFAVVALTSGEDSEPASTARATPTATGAAAAAASPHPGHAVFIASGCGSCHTFAPAGTSGPIGPALTGIGERRSAAALRAKILDPGAGSAMPEDFGERLDERELDALVAYLRTG
jgi:mono/diheme cytochrome c family protein